MIFNLESVCWAVKVEVMSDSEDKNGNRALTTGFVDEFKPNQVPRVPVGTCTMTLLV